MNLHPFLLICARLGGRSCCTSCALQPAAVVQLPCNKAPPVFKHPSPKPIKPMQGKIKGRGTTVRAKPCLHVGWRGTRGQQRCAVGGDARWRKRVDDYSVVVAVNATLEGEL
jgi:hypothetical protein